jgi:hypothetical protein
MYDAVVRHNEVLLLICLLLRHNHQLVWVVLGTVSAAAGQDCAVDRSPLCTALAAFFAARAGLLAAVSCCSCGGAVVWGLLGAPTAAAGGKVAVNQVAGLACSAGKVCNSIYACCNTWRQLQEGSMESTKGYNCFGHMQLHSSTLGELICTQYLLSKLN